MKTNAEAVAADAVMALKDGQNVLIKVAAPGVGALNALIAAMKDAGLNAEHCRSLMQFDQTDVKGMPFLAEANEIRWTVPRMHEQFAGDDVLVFDDAECAMPVVSDFIRSKGERGRIVLIFRDYNNLFDFAEYASFPGVRLKVDLV